MVRPLLLLAGTLFAKMERAYFAELKSRDLEVNFAKNCQNTDLRQQTVSFRIGRTDFNSTTVSFE